MPRSGERTEVINYGVWPTKSKDLVIPFDIWDPDYTDRRFMKSGTEGLTIFRSPTVTFIPDDLYGEIGEGLDYVYSGGIISDVGYEAYGEAWDRVVQELGLGEVRTARFMEHLLRIVFRNDLISLGHIKAGVNRDTQSSYKIYGYAC
ncbi:MAG TPA: hypothetical protein VMR76_01560 [Candidatus Saccharimonadia bacterium]|nr:hypothetical protein [Candidatus Saccharimonadia bacterium]